MTVGPDYQRPEPVVANRWQAEQPVAEGAYSVMPSDIHDWWAKFNDPELMRLIIASQRVSADIADTKARIEEARAGLVTANAQGLPRLDTQVDMLRARTTFGTPPFDWTRYQAGLQSNWEIDLFGGIARQREVAENLLLARQSRWHDAKVALAVEVANAYTGFRYCRKLVEIAKQDAESRAHSARLVDLAVNAGLRPPADFALAGASHADSEENLMRQMGECERAIKGMVALSGLSEAEIRYRLISKTKDPSRLPIPPTFRIESVPVRVVLSRPDVAAAEEELAEANAKIGVEEARRYPRLSLTGNITPQLQTVSGMSALSPYAAGASAASTYFANTWSFGPTLTMPVFDAGKRIADVEAARSNYVAVQSRFQSIVRRSVKEVEEAILRLHISEDRFPKAMDALQGYERNLGATDRLYRAGFSSLLELEQARRQQLAARRVLADLEHERVSAWIALYRAAGGGWYELSEDHLAESGGSKNGSTK